MSAVSDLIEADTLTLSQINWQIRLPLGQGDLSGSAPGTCLAKPTGQIAFQATLNQFGLPLTHNVTFTGTPNEAGSVVTWAVDTEPMRQDFMGYTITRIRGSLQTSLAPSMPVLGLDCSGVNARLFSDSLQASGREHTIDVQIDVLGGQTATAAIQFTAGVGRPPPATFFGVGIVADRWQSDSCGGRYQLFTPASSPVQFNANIENTRTTGNITSTEFLWTVDGPAHTDGPVNRASVQLSLDGPGEIIISVAVIVNTDLGSSGSAVGRVSFEAVAAEDVDLLRLVCRLRQLYRFIPERAPVGDPALGDMVQRNFASRPYNAVELGRVRVAAQRLIETASAVLKQADAVANARAASWATRFKD